MAVGEEVCSLECNTSVEFDGTFYLCGSFSQAWCHVSSVVRSLSNREIESDENGS